MEIRTRLEDRGIATGDLADLQNSTYSQTAAKEERRIGISTGPGCYRTLSMCMSPGALLSAAACINPVFSDSIKKDLHRIEIPLMLVSGNDDESMECISATSYHDLVENSFHLRIRSVSSDLAKRSDFIISSFAKFLIDQIGEKM
ncbi:MAG: hypothetical protein M1151_07290 [Candidatus Thermoplasmatota archaeon]|jgi:hypothetical protein|nr:hypothetical protein [Candidatus Thermoplasmatota archaeon]MCL5786447.1 hypothetical protein [Candidatus Thermoplasmatota archaeon]